MGNVQLFAVSRLFVFVEFTLADPISGFLLSCGSATSMSIPQVEKLLQHMQSHPSQVLDGAVLRGLMDELGKELQGTTQRRDV